MYCTFLSQRDSEIILSEIKFPNPGLSLILDAHDEVQWAYKTRSRSKLLSTDIWWW